MIEKLPPTELRAEDFLSSEQLIAIAKVAVEWAMLEHVLCAWGSSIFGLPFMTFARLTGNPGGRALADLLKELGPQYLKGRVDTADFRRALALVQEVADERNHVVHGVWNLPAGARGGWMPIYHEDPVPNVVLKGKGKDWAWQDRSTEEILTLAERIATIRFELNKMVHAAGHN